MKKILWLVLCLSSTYFFYAQQATVNTRNGLAVDGYDVVSYHKGSPQEGHKEYAAVIDGATYRFASRENMEAFKKDPSKYLPEYGGWCAYAMGLNGEKVSVDPETYKILDGRLYLFYNSFLNNTLKKWNQNEPDYLQNANRNWNNILNKKDHE